jgi:hypothetical protein
MSQDIECNFALVGRTRRRSAQEEKAWSVVSGTASANPEISAAVLRLKSPGSVLSRRFHSLESCM